MVALSEEAQALKREYYREYRKKNRERLNAYLRKWRSENAEKLRQYEQQYWERKVQFV